MTDIVSESIEVNGCDDCGNQDSVVEETTCETLDACETLESETDVSDVSVVPKFDKEKMKELVCTELNLEKQLESVQNQLLALKQLPSEIETHLRIVSEQLHKIMELSGIRKDSQDSSRIESGMKLWMQNMMEQWLIFICFRAPIRDC